MDDRLRIVTAAALLAGIVCGVAPAQATPCNGAAIDPRFQEAARLCDAGATGSAHRAAASRVDFPDTVAVQMAGRRAAAARSAVAPTAPVSGGALIDAVGRAYRIDPHLLASMVRQESGGHLSAVSNKGALGLMQVMPETARSIGVAQPRAMLTNPVLAMSAGAVYLKRLQAQFGNNVPLVLAAYNAGPGAVVHARGVPRYRETRGYVGAIMGRYTHGRAEPGATR